MNNAQILANLRMTILTEATNLTRNIDLYIHLKDTPMNTLAPFRDDAYQIACAAANEAVNPDDDTFSDKDADKALSLLQRMLVGKTA